MPREPASAGRRVEEPRRDSSAVEEGAALSVRQPSAQPFLSRALAMSPLAVAVSRPTDPGEQEAERVADTLSGGGPRGNESRAHRTGADVGTVYRAAVPAGMESGASVETPTGGRALDAGTRAWFEPRLGASLGDVRIHTDGSAAEAARHLNARAFTIGGHIGFGAGEYAPGTPGGHRLLAHELTHVVQQSSTHQAVSLVARAPVPSAHQPAQASPPAQAVSREYLADVTLVNAAIDLVFDNQHTALERLDKALHKKKEEVSVIAQLAAFAVGAAVGVLLGPVGGLAAEALIEAGDEAGRRLVEKISEKLIDKAKEKVADKTKEWVDEKIKETHKSDPLDNFIELQGLAINEAKFGAKAAFADRIPEFEVSPSGHTALRQLAATTHERSKLAESVQIAISAGAWASSIRTKEEKSAEYGSDTQAWVNDEHETFSYGGHLEIGTRVEKAPLSGSADIKIVDSNWRGINKETERVVQEHGGAKIGFLDASLRITVETPVGSTKCYYDGNNINNLLIPENTIGQSVWIWLGSGQMKPSPMPEDRAAVLSAAALFGYYLWWEKSTGELRFD